MSRYIELDEEEGSRRPRGSPKPKVRRRPATRRVGKQVRTVWASGLAACGGHSLLFAYGAEDFAKFCGVQSKNGQAGAAFRKAVRRGEVNPTDLASVFAFHNRRRWPGVPVKVLVRGELVATAMFVTLHFGECIEADVKRVRPMAGGRWEARRVEVILEIGSVCLSLPGRLTATRFEGGSPAPGADGVS